MERTEITAIYYARPCVKTDIVTQKMGTACHVRGVSLALHVKVLNIISSFHFSSSLLSVSYLVEHIITVHPSMTFLENLFF